VGLHALLTGASQHLVCVRGKLATAKKVSALEALSVFVFTSNKPRFIVPNVNEGGGGLEKARHDLNVWIKRRFKKSFRRTLGQFKFSTWASVIHGPRGRLVYTSSGIFMCILAYAGLALDFFGGEP